MKRKERHDLFKNLEKVQTNEQLFKFITKLLDKDLQENSIAPSSSELDLESLGIEDDDDESLATIQSENETSESEVNFRQVRMPVKPTVLARPQIKRPSPAPELEQL